MASITRFEEIEARQTARQLANVIYDLTDQMAFGRDYGLKDFVKGGRAGGHRPLWREPSVSPGPGHRWCDGHPALSMGFAIGVVLARLLGVRMIYDYMINGGAGCR